MNKIFLHNSIKKFLILFISISIGQFVLAEGHVVESQTISCYGEDDGELSFAASEGAVNTYSWQNSSGVVIGTSITIKALAAGSYTLVVTGPDAGTYSYTLVNPAKIKFGKVTVLSNKKWGSSLGSIGSNSGDCTGAISFNPQGGTGTLSYTLYDKLAHTTVSGLTSITNQAPGDYVIKITDAKGCSVDTTVNIPDDAKSPSAPFTITDPVYVCYKGVTGNSATPSNTDVYSIYGKWDCGLYDESMIDDSVSLDWQCGTKGTDEFETHVDYYVVDTFAITSNASLKAKYAPYYIEGLKMWAVPVSNNVDTIMMLAPTVRGVYANHTQYSPVTVSGWESHDSINVHLGLFLDANGDTITVDSVEKRSVSDYSSVTKIIKYGSLSYSELRPGFHIVYFWTGEGLGMRYSFNVLAPPNPVTINFTKKDETCYGDSIGTINVSAQGSWQDYDAPYSSITIYKTDNSKIGGFSVKSNVASASNLPAGLYTITATDVKSCSRTQTVKIDQPDEPMRIVFDQSKSATCPYSADGAVTISSVYGATYPVKYTWADGHTSESADSLLAGNYVVTVTDSLGCSVTDSSHVGASRKACLYNIVTPNGDGYNDYFDLSDFCYGMKMTCKIFDINGRLVGTLDEKNPKWDPLTDKSLPDTGQTSTYTAFIKLSKNGKKVSELAESFSVIYTK